jgi:glutaredoxin
MTADSDPVKLYWTPGCGNCVRVKDYLTTRGIEFEGVNAHEPDAFQDLADRGIMSLPAVVRGDRHVLGLDLAQLDGFFGFDSSERQLLPANELVQRMTSLLEAAMRFGAQLPAERWSAPTPRAGRTHLGLLGHIVDHVGIFVHLAEHPNVAYSREIGFIGMSRPSDPDLALGPVVERGRQLIASVRRWWDDGAADVTRPIDTWYGPQTFHQVLDSITYSVAQHTRQLASILRDLGIDPEPRLTDDDFRGIVLPTMIWGEERELADPAPA